MTYCKPGWTIDDLPIRSISHEEYQKELETDIPEAEFRTDLKIENRFPVDTGSIEINLEELLKLTGIGLNTASRQGILGIGTGRLMRYSNCQYGGDYSGFKKGKFLYLNWKTAYLKIRVDCRRKVADEIVELANYIRSKL